MAEANGTSGATRAGVDSSCPEDPGARNLSGWGLISLGTYLILHPIIWTMVLLLFWPTCHADSTAASPSSNECWGAVYFCNTLWFHIGYEKRLILVVTALGALGSYVHVVTSFAAYRGNRQLLKSWVWWYVLQPLVGSVLALVFYLLVRGGFLGAGTDARSVNLYGMASIAALAGMFAKQAVRKLDEIFDALFKTDKGKQLGDKLAPQPPCIVSLLPSTISPGSQDQVVVIIGRNFSPNASVFVRGTPRQTEFISATQLKAKLTATDLAAEAELPVTVKNPLPDGQESAPATIRIQK